MATYEEKLEFAQMLEKVHGVHYAFGWIQSAWANRHDPEIEDGMIHRTRNELLLELIKKEKHND